MNRTGAMLLLAVLGFVAFYGAGLFVSALALAAALLCAAALVPDAPGAEPARRFSRVEAAWLAVLGFMLLTLCPLPPMLMQGLCPLRAQQDQVALDALREASRLGVLDGTPSDWLPLTRNRAGTLRLLVLALAVGPAVLLSASLSAKGQHRLLSGVVFLGASVAILGYLGQWRFPQGNTFWWVFPMPPMSPGPVGGFGNRNHFAGFVAMTTPAALALMAEALHRRRWMTALAALAAAACMGGAVLFSLSRGALVAYAAGLGTTAFLLLVHRRFWTVSLAVLLAAGFIALAVALPHPAVRERLDTLRHPLATGSAETRTAAWRDTLRIWQGYPLIGAGPQAFRMVYPQFRTTSNSNFMTHPENEYLQLLAETGMAGVALALGVLLAFRFHRRGAERTPDATLTEVAAGGALAVAACHAAYDFALHVPLYAMVLGALCGPLLLVPDGGLPPADSHGRNRRRWVTLPGLMLSLALLPIAPAIQRLDNPQFLETADGPALARSLAWAPTSRPAWYFLGRLSLRSPSPEAWTLGERCLTQAADYDPQNYKLWHELGQLRLKLDDRTGARDAFRRVRELRSWVPVPDIPE